MQLDKTLSIGTHLSTTTFGDSRSPGQDVAQMSAVKFDRQLTCKTEAQTRILLETLAPCGFAVAGHLRGITRTIVRTSRHFDRS